MYMIFLKKQTVYFLFLHKTYVNKTKSQNKSSNLQHRTQFDPFLPWLDTLYGSYTGSINPNPPKTMSK